MAFQLPCLGPELALYMPPQLFGEGLEWVVRHTGNHTDDNPRCLGGCVLPSGSMDPTPEQSGLSARWAREGMPPWIPRLLLMILGLVILALIAEAIFNQLRGFFILLLISLFLSIALEPAVKYLSNRGMRRGVATGIIFVVVFGFMGLFVGLMVPLIVDQTILLVDRIPGYVEDLGNFTERFGLDLSSERVDSALSDFDATLQDLAADLAGQVFGVGTRLLATLFSLLAIGLFTFYMTADGPRMRRVLLSWMPEDRQREVLRVWEIAIDKTGGYFYSRALLAAIAALATWIVLRITGVPFALPLALWTGLFSQFVPVVGTYIGGALPLLIALLESPAKALVVLIFIIVYQQIENYLLSPHITAHTMALHPAVAFGAAVVGASLLGVPGALMALPIAATFQAFISTYRTQHEVVESDLTRPRAQTISE